MLSRPGPLPSGLGWSYELKWDGFRAIVSTEDALLAEHFVQTNLPLVAAALTSTQEDLRGVRARLRVGVPSQEGQL